MGMCAEADFENMPAGQKEEFAWKCKAPCRKDFSGCPHTWVSVGNGLCLASPEYDGMCSPATDFSTFSSQSKAAWARRCGVSWPYIESFSDREEGGPMDGP